MIKKTLQRNVFLGAGENVGLDIVLAPETASYLALLRPMYGVSLIVHGHNEYPDFAKNNFFAQPGYDFEISVIPSAVTTQPDVRSLPLKQRKCLFDDEVIRLN